MSNGEILRILSNSEVFHGLTNTDLEILSQHCEKRAFQKGDTLIKERHPASGFHIIVKGKLEVLLPEHIEGRREQRVSEVKLNVLKEGDCFGEYAIIGKMPASASIVAMESGEVLRIAEDDFNRVLANDRIARAVYHNLLRTVLKRLRKREKEYDLFLVIP
jgi:CRP/FNR family cyclic AMP-dependent transcriptional regulator